MRTQGYKNLIFCCPQPQRIDQGPFSQKFLTRFLTYEFRTRNLMCLSQTYYAYHVQSWDFTSRNSSLVTVSNGLIFREKSFKLKISFHSREINYRSQVTNFVWNSVLENWRHNHYMWAKIGQSYFLRQTFKILAKLNVFFKNW